MRIPLIFASELTANEDVERAGFRLLPEQSRAHMKSWRTHGLEERLLSEKSERPLVSNSGKSGRARNGKFDLRRRKVQMPPSQTHLFGQLPSLGSDELAGAPVSLSLTTRLILNDLTWASHNRLIPALIGFHLLDTTSETRKSLKLLLALSICYCVVRKLAT
jgi:hypothetical protein